MEWYYKNRGRCNISKKRLKTKFFTGIIFVFVISFFCLFLIDKRINKVLEPYINVEVERLVNNVVVKIINEKVKGINIDDIIINNNSNEFYDTTKINLLEKEIDDALQEEIIKIDDGKIDDIFIPERIKKSKFKKVKNGILCDVSIGSIRNSTLFANVGPVIPIKLTFTSQLNSNIDIDIKEYGINNVIVEVYYVGEFYEQITMPMTSKRRKIVVKKPVLINIIKGKIPDYYMGHT